jgi:hypothetical protein
LIKCGSLTHSLPDLIEAEHIKAMLDQLVQSPMNDIVRVEAREKDSVEAHEKDSVEALTEKMGHFVV